MTVALAALSLAMFLLGIGVLVIALCRAASRPAPHPPVRHSHVDALESMGAECEIVDFGGWRNRGPRAS